MRSDRGLPVILDTTVLVHLARDTETGRAIERQYGLSKRPDRPLISTIAEGEVLGLAKQWGWGDGKLRALRDLLGELVPVEAGMSEIVEAYAELYALAMKRGKPAGENDLWIAATARVAGAELFTCDKDFTWLHPDQILVHYIGQC